MANIVQRGTLFLRKNGLLKTFIHASAHPRYRWELFKARNILFKNHKLRIEGNMITVKEGKELVRFKIHTEQISEYSGWQNTVGLVMEQFIYSSYKQLQCKNRNIIDLGACLADSTLYFAARDAKHVFAY